MPPKKTKDPKITPPKAGAGRPKGSLNKTTGALKEAILKAAAKHGDNGKGKGGLEGYLFHVASTEPVAFCGLLKAVLPMTVAGDPDQPVNIVVQWGKEPTKTDG